MKNIIVCFIIICCNQLSGQNNILTAKDSSAIMFKAQLMTISEYGIGNKEQIIKDLTSQKTKFLKNSV